MSRETENTEIGGQRYICTMMPATLANKTLITLVEIIGRPAATILANAFTEKDFGDIDIEELAGVAMQAVFERFDGERGDAIVKALLVGVRVEGINEELSTTAAFDKHFRGRILTLYKVFRWSVEVNYRDFFDVVRSSGLITKISSAGAKALSRVITTPTSSESSSPTRE